MKNNFHKLIQNYVNQTIIYHFYPDHFPALSLFFLSSFDALNCFNAFESFVYNGIRLLYQSENSLSTFAATFAFPDAEFAPLDELFPLVELPFVVPVVEDEEFEDDELELELLEFFGVVELLEFELD